MKIKLSALIIVAIFIVTAGCSNSNKLCEIEPIKNNGLNGRWANYVFSEITISVVEQPYKISDSTIKSVSDFFSQFNIKTKVIKSSLILPRGDLLHDQVVNLMKESASEADCPTIIIAKVDRTLKDDGSAYRRLGSVTASYRPDMFTPPSIGVIILDQQLLLNIAERTVLLHEVGHFFGIPVRHCHTIPGDTHCTNLNCIMCPGPSSLGVCGVLKLVLTNPLTFGVPNGYCKPCMAELKNALTSVKIAK